MFLSIVIPVYNAEFFLKRCVLSVLNQGLSRDDYEILLVNDGSMDNSWNICQKLKDEYPDVIRIFTQENQGVSFTRQFGIEEAKGEYIAFCDADDYLIPGGYKYLKDNFLFDKKIDILSFYSKTVSKEEYEIEISSSCAQVKIVYEGTGWDFYRFNCHTFVWNHLYRRAYILEKRIKFKPHNIGEDVMFNLDLAMTNPKMRVVSAKIYCYEHHPNSIIHNRDALFLRTAIKDYVALLALIKSYSKKFIEKDPILSRGLNLYLNGQLIPFLSRVLSSDYSYKEFIKLRRVLKLNSVLPIKVYSNKDRILSCIFNTYPFFKIYQWGFKNVFMKYIYSNMDRKK